MGSEMCIRDSNNASDIFVPTKTADEWSAFKNNATGVAICKDCDNDGYGECPACGIANGCTYDGDDCCDSDNRAYPGESTYYSSTNNCGSWDYDCSGTINKSNCTYDTVVRSGQSCSCYWTSTCLAGTATGYQYCEETSHTASCGTTNYHHRCTVGCRQRCPTNTDWDCESPPCPGSPCSYSTYYYDSLSTRDCVCK